MEDSLENWISNMEMEDYDDVVLSENHGSFDEQQFLREILEEPQNLSLEGENLSPSNSSVSFDEAIGGGTLHKSNSSNSIKSLKISSSVSPATTYLLSFDTSTAEPITHHKPSPKLGPSLQGSASKRGAVVKDGPQFEPFMPQPRKKVRRSSETQHHIIAERKRRQELTGSIIALSATIPGLKRMDKAYVLREAVNYTKQLQERIKELENQNNDKRVNHSSALVRKYEASSNKSSSNISETNKESVFEVDARALDEEVLIGIHCEKQKDIVCKILALLEKLHLSPSSSSVLPFGTSTLIIHIIAQMDEECRMSMDELVKKLREYMLEVYDMQH